MLRRSSFKAEFNINGKPVEFISDYIQTINLETVSFKACIIDGKFEPLSTLLNISEMNIIIKLLSADDMVVGTFQLENVKFQSIMNIDDIFNFDYSSQEIINEIDFKIEYERLLFNGICIKSGTVMDYRKLFK